MTLFVDNLPAMIDWVGRPSSSDQEEVAPMNSHQRITLALGLIVVAGFGVYVPWDAKVELYQNDEWVTWTERPTYSFVWNLPDPKLDRLTNDGVSWDTRLTANVNYQKILLFWFVTAVVTAAVTVLLGLTQSPRAETPDSTDDKMD